MSCLDLEICAGLTALCCCAKSCPKVSMCVGTVLTSLAVVMMTVGMSTHFWTTEPDSSALGLWSWCPNAASSSPDNSGKVGASPSGGSSSSSSSCDSISLDGTCSIHGTGKTVDMGSGVSGTCHDFNVIRGLMIVAVILAFGSLISHILAIMRPLKSTSPLSGILIGAVAGVFGLIAANKYISFFSDTTQYPLGYSWAMALSGSSFMIFTQLIFGLLGCCCMI